MARTGVILARYTCTRDGRALSGREQQEVLTRLNNAPPIAYRVRDPKPDDRTNYIIRPDAGERRGRPFLTWQVCKELHQRTVRKVDRRNQKVTFDFEPTEDCALARVVVLPGLGVLAAEDASGENHIGGWSAIKRFEAMIEALDESLEFSAALAGTAQDLSRAIEKWELEKFSFEVRPFNPHPSSPGLILSDLLARDGIGKLNATAVPKQGGHIEPQTAGIVQETLGLAEQGYAVYGAEGTTPSGAEARVKKPSFSFDRNRNLEKLRGPQQLRVSVQAESEDDMIEKLADVLIDFFDTDEIDEA
jgi:hypothetical protein